MSGEFYQLSRSWYAPEQLAREREQCSFFVDDIFFSFDDCDGECCMTWYELRDGEKPSPRLEVYSDSWECLAKHPEFWAELAQHPDIQPDEFCQFLERHGFTDVTSTTPPYAKGG